MALLFATSVSRACRYTSNACWALAHEYEGPSDVHPPGCQFSSSHHLGKHAGTTAWSVIRFKPVKQGGQEALEECSPLL